MITVNRMHRLRLLSGGLMAALVGSALLITAHLDAVRTVRATQSQTVLVADLLTQHATLAKQAEGAAADDVLTGSLRERVQLHVLPEGADTARLVQTVETLRNALEREHHLTSMAPLTMTDPTPVPGLDGMVSRTVTTSMTLTDSGTQTLLTFLAQLGTLTVSDALRDDDRKQIAAAAASMGNIPLEPLAQFLATDLATFAAHERALTDRLLLSYSSDGFRLSLQAMLRSPTLSDAVSFLRSDIGAELLSQKLWPLPLTTMRSLEIDEGMVAVVLEVYGRASSR